MPIDKYEPEDFIVKSEHRRKSTLALRKPRKDEPFRVHPDDSNSPHVYLMTKESNGNELWVVHPRVAEKLPNEPTIVKHRVYRCYSVDAGQFLWPVKDPIHKNEWYVSCHDLAKKARGTWIRIAANSSAGRYESAPCDMNGKDPKWSEEPVAVLLNKAMDGRFVADLDDPELVSIRGSSNSTKDE